MISQMFSDTAGATLVVARSPLTRKMNSLRIEMPFDEFAAAHDKWRAGALIQDAFPMLSPDEREFLMTGITAADWEMMFPDLDYRE